MRIRLHSSQFKLDLPITLGRKDNESPIEVPVEEGLSADFDLGESELQSILIKPSMLEHRDQGSRLFLGKLWQEFSDWELTKEGDELAFSFPDLAALRVRVLDEEGQPAVREYLTVALSGYTAHFPTDEVGNADAWVWPGNIAVGLALYPTVQATLEVKGGKNAECELEIPPGAVPIADSFPEEWPTRGE